MSNDLDSLENMKKYGICMDLYVIADIGTSTDWFVV